MTIRQKLTWLLGGIAIGSLLTPVAFGARAERQVLEIRTYTTHEGRLDALHTRFRNHTMRLFEKHGMRNVAYWTPEDPALQSKTLVYVLAHQSREAAKRSWESFVNDPEWKQVKSASEADGPIIVGIESVFGEPTDYSPVR